VAARDCTDEHIDRRTTCARFRNDTIPGPHRLSREHAHAEDLMLANEKDILKTEVLANFVNGEKVFERKQTRSPTKN